MKRLGFFTGSFDPVHEGHLGVAKSALKFLDLNKLYIMVEENPWTDKKPIDISHRKKMVNIALKDINDIGQLEIGDKRFDIQNTLTEIENKYPNDELYFVFGADVFMKMDKDQWPGLEKLLKHYIVVFERNKITQEQISEHAKTLGIVVAIMPSEYPEHSSTDVRMRPAEKNIWVPELVAKYIDKNKLYRL